MSAHKEEYSQEIDLTQLFVSEEVARKEADILFAAYEDFIKKYPDEDLWKSNFKEVSMIIAELDLRYGAISLYAHLNSTINFSSDDAIASSLYVGAFKTKVIDLMRPYSSWLKMLSDDDFEEVLEQVDNLEIGAMIASKRRVAEHLPSLDVQKSIEAMSRVSGANKKRKLLLEIFSYELMGVPISLADLNSYINGSDLDVVKLATEEKMRAFEENKHFLFEIFRSRVLEWKEKSKAYSHESPISMRNFKLQIPDQAVENLIKEVEKRGPFHRSFLLLGKKVQEKKDSLHKNSSTSEVRALSIEPKIVNGENIQKLYFSKVVESILFKLGGVDLDFYNLAKKMFLEKRVSTKQLPDSKKFANFGNPSTGPFIVSSIEDRSRSIATLIHELGHAIHAKLIHENNKLYNYGNSSSIIKESFAIFFELLFSDDSEAGFLDREEFLLGELKRVSAVIFWLIHSVKFEIYAHEAIDRGASVDEVSEKYLEIQKEVYEGRGDIPDYIKFYWLSLGQLLRKPFNVSSYAFGILLAITYSEKLKKDPAYIDKIKEMMGVGGSMTLEDTLKIGEINLSDENVFDGAWKYIEDMMGELEGLVFSDQKPSVD